MRFMRRHVIGRERDLTGKNKGKTKIEEDYKAIKRKKKLHKINKGKKKEEKHQVNPDYEYLEHQYITACNAGMSN